MRSLAFLFFCVALASAGLVQKHHESKNADKDFLLKQKNIFHLLYHVHQPNIHHDQVEIGKQWHNELLNHLDHFNHPEVVRNIVERGKDHLLPKDAIFSVIYDVHVQKAVNLFKLFYYAKDYETFYKTACWAREYVNEQLFVYGLSVAVIHRPDTQGIVLPPPYEIHPYFFFPSDVIHQAYLVKMQKHGEHLSPSVHTVEGNTVIINSNYSGWWVHYNDEQKMSYLTEDIAWNTLYYYYHLDYPFWMSGEEFGLLKDRRGEVFYHFHQQILARYYLERLSNGLGEIPKFSWNWPVETGFYPSLQYHNGMEFPVRPNHFSLNQEDFLPHLIQVTDYEHRIRNAIDSGLMWKKDGSKVVIHDPEDIEYVASIVESNADTPNLRYYKYPLSIAKMLLGNSPKPMNYQKITPSALEQFQTCLRDPMFYQLHKRYIGFFTQFQNTLHPYTKEELLCPGVTIENVEVEKLVTYFEHYDVDITNVVYQTKEEVQKLNDDVTIKARQYRLNHMPFTVTVNTVAEKGMKVLVKMFLGPKYDGVGHLMSVKYNRENFVELDQFVYELKAGKNTIQRNSNDFMWTIKDWTPSRKIYQEVNDALAGGKAFPLDMTEAHNGFPSRLMLPRGRKGGMPYQLFVVIAPHVIPKVEYGAGFDHVISSGVGSGARNIDGHSLGYPFDRPIDETYFVNHNMHFEDVIIFHKKETEINQPTMH